MPRDGSNIYSQPFPDVVEDTTIESTVYNGFTNDIAADLNAARPIVAGGTGATNADQALFNLAAEKATQVVTNYDSHLWIPGSFRSATTATGAPVADHAFAGVCYINEALAYPPTNQNVVVEALDTTDTINIVKYIKVKTSGVWSSWTGISSGSAAASIGEYTTDSNITFPPSSGQIRLNNVTQNSATEIFISHTTVTGTDNTNLIPFVIKVGSDIAIQDKDEIAKYKIFTATADPVLSGGDYRVTVTFKSGGTDLGLAQRVLVGATGGGTVSYSVSQTLTETQKTQARKNIYAAPLDALAYSGMQVNGSMEVSQERGVSVAVASGYVCDVWNVLRAGTMVLSASQIIANALSGLPGGITFCLNIGITTSQPSLGAGDYAAVLLNIEGYRIARLAWGTANAQSITIGFWTAHGRTGLYSVKVGNSAVNRSYAATYTQNVASTWQFNTVTIPGCTDGSWYNDTTTGIGLVFTQACGTTFTAPAANVWYTTNYLAAPGQVNGVTTTGSDAFRLTGVVVLPGTEAPSAARSPLIMRPYDQELLTCQRHYWRDSVPTWMFAENVSAGVGINTVVLPVKFPQTMRATPIVTLPTLTLGGCGTPQTTSAPPNQYGTTIAASSTGAVGSRMYMLYASGSLIADARL